MRFFFSLLLIVSGLSGVLVSLASDISLSSQLYVLDGLEFSSGLAVFSIVIFLNGIYNLFTNNCRSHK
jgi:hypothetical protein